MHACVCVHMVCCQGGHLCPKDAQCSLDKVPVLLKSGREVTREKGHISPWSGQGMQRQVSLTPTKGGRGKTPGLPLEEGVH